jgi:hypothetical protein
MITGPGGIQISQLLQSGSPFLNPFFPFRKAQLDQEAQRCMESIDAGTKRIQEVTTCLAVVGNAVAADERMVATLNQRFKSMPWMEVPPISADDPALGIYKAMKYTQIAMERVMSSEMPETERNAKINAAKGCLEVLKQVLGERDLRIAQVNQALKVLGGQMPGLAPPPPSGVGATDPTTMPPATDAPDSAPPPSSDPTTEVTQPTEPALSGPTTAPPTADSSARPVLGKNATRADLMKVVDALKGMLRPLETKLREDMASLTVINIRRQGVVSVFAELFKAHR